MCWTLKIYSINNNILINKDMNDIVFSIYDSNGKYIGFTYDEEDAQQMANKYNGHYDWWICGSNSIFS